jgi:hypothetical protein
MTQKQVLLCVRLMDPGDPKLLRCRFFWDNYPSSPALAEVLLTIVKDAVATFDREGRWDRSRSQKYMDAGLSAATALVQKWPKTAELDVHAYELCKRLAQDEKYEKAIPLAKALLAAVSDSPLKERIGASIAEWEGLLPNPERDALLKTVKATVICFDDTRTWDGPAGQKCMEDGLSAATELLQKWPKTTGLDTLVYELAKRLAQGKQCQKAIDLARTLLAAIPDSVLRRQIEASIAQWQKDCRPPVIRITDVRVLQEKLDGGAREEVLGVALSKAVVGANITKLQEWTRAGGVLWVETDLAEAFGLGNVTRVPPRMPQGGPTVPRIPYDIVKGLEDKVIGCQVDATGGVISGSEQDIFSRTSSVMPLLVQSMRVPQGRRDVTIFYVFCGVRRYGEGFVVFRPMKIDMTSDAGRRLEELLCFRAETAAQSIRGR